MKVSLFLARATPARAVVAILLRALPFIALRARAAAAPRCGRLIAFDARFASPLRAHFACFGRGPPAFAFMSGTGDYTALRRRRALLWRLESRAGLGALQCRAGLMATKIPASRLRPLDGGAGWIDTLNDHRFGALNDLTLRVVVHGWAYNRRGGAVFLPDARILLPTAALLPPVVALTFPSMRNPVMARPRGIPAARYPDVTHPAPVPVTGNPDMANTRRGTVILVLRRRRRHAHNRLVIIGIMHRISRAGTQQNRGGSQCGQ